VRDPPGREEEPVSRPEVVSDGLPFGEGPVWCPDGSLVCTSVSHGALYRIWPAEGRTEVLVETGGGANAALRCDDGSFVVCQNGGIDLVAMGHMKDAPPVRWMTPGLQLAQADGTVLFLTTEPMQAPNDLAPAPDGSVVFTDPGLPPTGGTARIMVWRPDGSTELLAGGFEYTNGIAVDLDGTSVLVVTDDVHLTRFLDLGQGGSEPAIEFLGDSGGDGLCLDAEGRYYVAARLGAGVRVFDRDGQLVEFLEVEPGNSFITNCCFGGPDLRTLFATDARLGQVVAWDAMPTAGLPIPPLPRPAVPTPDVSTADRSGRRRR